MTDNTKRIDPPLGEEVSPSEEETEKYEPQMLRLQLFPSKILKEEIPPLSKDRTEEENAALAKLLLDMHHTMEQAGGIGLAANQVGAKVRLFVMKGGRYFINPEIVESEGEISIAEGCLSFPTVSVKVKRAVRIKLKHEDVEGNEMVWDLEGVEAIVAQHELDHLNGITFYDHASSVKKDMIRRKMKKLKKKWEKIALASRS